MKFPDPVVKMGEEWSRLFQPGWILRTDVCMSYGIIFQRSLCEVESRSINILHRSSKSIRNCFYKHGAYGVQNGVLSSSIHKQVSSTRLKPDFDCMF
jgi:hypothetical protein